MLSHSGTYVMPLNRTFPSLQDVARSLAQMPRFAGNTEQPWTVLQHSLACFACARETRGYSRRLGLLTLLHDAHEAVIGDIPSTWKTAELRQICLDLDARMFASWDIDPATPSERAWIHEIDHSIFEAEAIMFANQRFLYGDDAVDEYPITTLSAVAVRSLMDVLRQFPSAMAIESDTIRTATSRAMKCFVQEVREHATPTLLP